MVNINLVDGFTQSEKYLSKWESSPSGGENEKYLEPPPSHVVDTANWAIIYHLNPTIKLNWLN